MTKMSLLVPQLLRDAARFGRFKPEGERAIRTPRVVKSESLTLLRSAPPSRNLPTL